MQTCMNFIVVPVGGLEPPHISIPDFESGVSTISPHWLLRVGMIVIYCLKYCKCKKNFFCRYSLVGTYVA